jgi:hypothetical protein
MKNFTSRNDVGDYLKTRPAQLEIYNYLCAHPEGCAGAVRTNQRARGFVNDKQCGGRECLEPLYRLVDVGLVSVDSSGPVDLYKAVLVD